MKIVTSFDWVAIDADTYEPSDPDGETGLRNNAGHAVGHGATEQEAIADLLEIFEYEARS